VEWRSAMVPATLAGMGTRLKKRPCRFCGKWFWPDQRVGTRQCACSAEECQARRRAETQAAWRRCNPEYAITYRMQKRAALPERDRPAARHPPPLDRLPWDLAKDQFDVQGCEFMEVFGRLLLAGAKDEIQSEVVKITRELAAHPPPGAKDQTGPLAG
jgi:hypothetical protein